MCSNKSNQLERSAIKGNFLSKDPKNKILWCKTTAPVDYEYSTNFMEHYANEIYLGIKPELVWLLEHPPLYSAGTSAKESDLLDRNTFPIFNTNRGGQYTYHGPGQRVVYLMLNLKNRTQDVRAYISTLEKLIINTLRDFDIIGEQREERVGIWVKNKSNEDKIAAIGIRLRKWVSFHGIAINVNPNLEHFKGIIPCILLSIFIL